GGGGVEDIEQISGKGDNGGRGRGPRRNGNRRTPQDISTLLREGQEILVQIAKEPIGTKGARITSHVSIAGRHLVLTPWSQRVGVSRRIDSDRERRRLREVVERIRPKDLGFIIRTAGEGTREADLEADVRYLTKVWDDIQIAKDQVRAPAVLYGEPALPLRVIRDFANGDTKRIVVDGPPVYEEMKSFMDDFVADPKPELELYEGADPLFDHFGAEARIDQNLGRKAWLKSGGYLIIDQSEALTAIDVNTGRYVGKSDLEETVLRTNLEAVKEVVNQLRFRNIGGLIIIDLIDMEPAANREKVYRALQEAIRGDKAKTNILKISELGLVEMTRKRTRENLVQTLCEPCGYCEGKGYVLSDESVAFKVIREIRKDLPRFSGRRLEVTVHRRVAEQLLTVGKESLAQLESELGRELEIRARGDIHQEQFEVRGLDAAEPFELDLAWLKSAPPKDSKPKKAAAPAGDEADAKAPAKTDEAEEPKAAAEETPEVAATPSDSADAEKTPEIAATPSDAAPETDEEAPESPPTVAAEATASGKPDGKPAAAAAAPAESVALLAPEPTPPQPVDAEGESPILPGPEKREES
ncbi:MAG: Rne/Rng family ribonuclease, partial [Myxococcota bacterium]